MSVGKRQAFYLLRKVHRKSLRHTVDTDYSYSSPWTLTTATVVEVVLRAKGFHSPEQPRTKAVDEQRCHMGGTHREPS